MLGKEVNQYFSWFYLSLTWKRKLQHIPVFLPVEFHGQRSLVGYSPWSRKESDMTELLHSLIHSSLNVQYLDQVLKSFIDTQWEIKDSVMERKLGILVQFSSVQLLSRVRLFVTPLTAAQQASLSISNSRSSPKPMSLESVMPSNYLIVCRPLLLLPSIFPSIRVFSSESALLIRWPKYWSFSFNISPSSEHPGLNSFRMDWLDLLEVQGTIKSLLQHHSSKASILRCSAFFIV